MERSQGKLLYGKQILFEDFVASTAVFDALDDELWPGRYWLPDGDRVEPTHKYCLIRGDGRWEKCRWSDSRLVTSRKISPRSRAVANSRDAKALECAACDQESV